MSIKNRIEKLEGKAGAGYCFVFPMYRDKEGTVEGHPKLPDNQVASVEFLVEGDGEGFVVAREADEAFDAFEVRAFEEVEVRFANPYVTPRGVHLV